MAFSPTGVYSAMLTPLHNGLKINEQVLRRMVDFMIDRGLHGLFPVSSVGEGLHMDRAQKIECMNIVMDQIRGRVPMTPGVASTHPSESIVLAKHAASIGAKAVVISPPYYYKPSNSMLEKFFGEIVQKAGLPVIIYNIPLFTTPISYDVMERLAKLDGVVGIKDSSGSMVDFLHFKDVLRPEVACLSGREEILLPTLVMGGRGCMTAMSGIFPEIMVGVWNAFHAGDMKRAQELQQSILPAMRLMFKNALPIGLKIGLELRGFEMGETFLPLADEDQALAMKVKAELKPIVRDLEAKYC